MNHQLHIQNAVVELIVRRHPRARRTILSIRKGKVVLTVPRRGSVERALAWVESKKEWLHTQLQKVAPEPVESAAAQRRQYLIHRAAAHRLVKDLLIEVNALYGFLYHKVTIRNQSSRWGSCSRSGNLSFNYRIVFLPAHLQRYIIAHELAHLREHNHGVRFWHLVGQAVESPKACQKALFMLGLK